MAMARSCVVNGSAKRDGITARRSSGVLSNLRATICNNRRSWVTHPLLRQPRVLLYRRISSSLMNTTSMEKLGCESNSGKLTSSSKISSRVPRLGDFRRLIWLCPSSASFKIHFSCAIGYTNRTWCWLTSDVSFCFTAAKFRVWISNRRLPRTMSTRKPSIGTSNRSLGCAYCLFRAAWRGFSLSTPICCFAFGDSMTMVSLHGCLLDFLMVQM